MKNHNTIQKLVNAMGPDMSHLYCVSGGGCAPVMARRIVAVVGCNECKTCTRETHSWCAAVQDARKVVQSALEE